MTRSGRLASILLLWIIVLAAGPAAAQDQIPALRLNAPPRIDGLLDDGWGAASSVTSFVQLEPILRGTPCVRTDVWAGYDGTHLYLAARLWQRRDTIRTGTTRRDGRTMWDGDFVTFVLDPLLSGNSAYFLAVNPSGAVADGILTASADWNTDWDGVWTSSVRVSDDHWIVEVALPLSTIGFQPAVEQDWGFLAVRRYVEGQERILSALPDANSPYRIDRFPRLVGLAGLATRAHFSAQPYVYGTLEADAMSGIRRWKGKFGGDSRLAPTPNVTVLATARPDYAQLESDQEIINVADVPTAYPEKRPFFTESSDFYQALAVNTRNIGAIDGGVKLRHVRRTFRYDATAVRDTNRATWLLGDARWTDNRRYLAEVIGGVRGRDGRRDYNVTANLRGWFLEKKVTGSSWFGTINGPSGGRNEFETVNTLKWLSRTFDAGVWTHVKSTLYNPDQIGYSALSNEVIFSAWASPSFINDHGLFRRITPAVSAERFAVYSGPGSAYTLPNLTAEMELHPSDTVGNWLISVGAIPASQQYFSYRNTGQRRETLDNADGYGPFLLVGQRLPGFRIAVRSDQGKPVSGRVAYDRGQVRGSRSESVDGQLTIRLSPSSSAAYILNMVRIPGSPWQTSSSEAIHRLKIEQAVGRTLDLRAVVQLSRYRQPLLWPHEMSVEQPVAIVTATWRPDPGTTIFVVYNHARASEARSGAGPRTSSHDTSLAIKMTRAFTF